MSLGLGLLVSACSGTATSARPERAAAEFIDRMQRVHGDPQAARAAYDLLWAEARQNLADRAKRASAATGTKVAPEEMLAASRFWLRFTPKRYESRVNGEWAVVIVSGDSPNTAPHEFRCALEDGQWRVALVLPPVPPVQRRAVPGR